ncbi:MAG: hypothetical protein HZA36_01160 [Parcubacteria group bacterium]|nr:hypothetical protein [Parcubacteria group bacterium]
MEDAEHRKGRIRFLYKKQRDLEAERKRLIVVLQRNCLHTKFLLATNNVPLSTQCTWLCIECGLEESGRLDVSSETFVGIPNEKISLARLKDYRTDYLQISNTSHR